MGFNRIGRMAQEMVRDEGGNPRHVTLTDSSLTETLKSTDKVVIIDTTSVTGDGNAIATLPPLAEMTGKMICIKAPKAATGGDLSLYEHETGSELSTYGDLDADGDVVVLYCVGDAWVPLYETVS
jgi:hypothetical protein